MRKAIFLFNKTLVAPLPWINAGYECWLFDGQHLPGVTRSQNIVRVGMMFKAEILEEQILEITQLVGDGVEFICSFAECTYLTTTGARWFYHPDDKHLPTSERRPHPLYPNRWAQRDEAVEMAKMAERLAHSCGIDCWMLENPAVSFLNKLWRGPDHKFDPCDYGGYLPVDDIHPVYPGNYPPRDAYRKNTGIWCGPGFVMPEKLPVESQGQFAETTKGGGKSIKNKNMRSYTPRGFARAIFTSNGKNHA